MTQFVKLKSKCIIHIVFRLSRFSPVVCELNIKWLSEVAALKLRVHSQTRILIADLCQSRALDLKSIYFIMQNVKDAQSIKNLYTSVT